MPVSAEILEDVAGPRHLALGRHEDAAVGERAAMKDTEPDPSLPTAG
jgi:hypothetical protein